MKLAQWGQTLQLRVFIAKSSGMLFPRECPERYPIYLSEDISKTLGDYKKLIFQGLTLLMESAKIEVDQSELLSLMRDMPMFPDVGLFNLRFDSLDLFKNCLRQSLLLTTCRRVQLQMP